MFPDDLIVAVDGVSGEHGPSGPGRITNVSAVVGDVIKSAIGGFDVTQAGSIFMQLDGAF